MSAFHGAGEDVCFLNKSEIIFKALSCASPPHYNTRMLSSPRALGLFIQVTLILLVGTGLLDVKAAEVGMDLYPRYYRPMHVNAQTAKDAGLCRQVFGPRGTPVFHQTDSPYQTYDTFVLSAQGPKEMLFTWPVREELQQISSNYSQELTKNIKTFYANWVRYYGRDPAKVAELQQHEFDLNIEKSTWAMIMGREEAFALMRLTDRSQQRLPLEVRYPQWNMASTLELKPGTPVYEMSFLTIDKALETIPSVNYLFASVAAFLSTKTGSGVSKPLRTGEESLEQVSRELLEAKRLNPDQVPHYPQRQWGPSHVERYQQGSASIENTYYPTIEAAPRWFYVDKAATLLKAQGDQGVIVAKAIPRLADWYIEQFGFSPVLNKAGQPYLLPDGLRLIKFDVSSFMSRYLFDGVIPESHLPAWGQRGSDLKQQINEEMNDTMNFPSYYSKELIEFLLGESGTPNSN